MPGGACERVKERGTLGLFQGPARMTLPPAAIFVGRRGFCRLGWASTCVKGRSLGQVGEPASPQVMHGLGSSTHKTSRIAGDRRLLLQRSDELGSEVREPLGQHRQAVSEASPKGGRASSAAAPQPATAQSQRKSSLSFPYGTVEVVGRGGVVLRADPQDLAESSHGMLIVAGRENGCPPWWHGVIRLVL